MSTDASLYGQVAVVTGASRGLGRAMAQELARAGVNVVLAARNPERLRAVAEEIGALGSSAVPVPTDITDPGEVRHLAESAVQAFDRIDILVNNSGILVSAPLLEHSIEDWDAVHATNVRGTFLTTREIGRHLVERGRGKVINIASNFAFKGIPLHAAYCSSKAAVIAFTRTIATEWARYNVQVNALAPGYFATDLNASVRADPATYERIIKAVPQRRMGTADELAPWVLHLAGPESGFVTGETIVIDGGQIA
jgi:2-deoxy-D-gluconate 3-dehydrogenase